MKANPVIAVLGRELTGEKPVIQITEKNRWMESLTAGQILKGRIMKYYGDDRYGIHFSGQERIVDSAIPLSVGETLSGKVIGLSENAVSMQVISTHKSVATTDQPKQVSSTKTGEQPHSLANIIEMMQQSGLKLNQLQLTAVANAIKGLEQPEMAIRIGLYLAKLGLPISTELVRSLYTKVLAPQPLTTLSEEEKSLPQLVSVSSAENPSPTAVIEALMQYFSKHFSNQQDIEFKQRRGLLAIDSSTSSERQAFQNAENKDGDTSFNDFLFFCHSQILNTQTGATYQHRFDTLPIMINGRVVEFDLALFDHSQQGGNEAGVQSRYLKFALTTEFGRIALEAQVLNERVRLQLAADSDWVAKEFEQYQSDLYESLASTGWQLETAEYHAVNELSTPAAAVIEHVLAQDSLQISI